MKTSIMHIFSRTPVHVGAGNSVGVVDSPIMRERHTKTPIIPGSSLKGVLADLWNDESYNRTDAGKTLLGDGGENAKAGDLLFGEARVLAFPVRSAKGSFAWITCPLALQRYERDTNSKLGEYPAFLEEDQCWASEDILIGDDIVLEEYKFASEQLCDDVSSKLKAKFSDPVWQTIDTRLVIVSDEIFSYFVENACEVVTRICVDDKSGVVINGALFNQEQCPSETMFYSVIGAQKNGASLEALKQKLEGQNNVIQVGGNATIGLGFCSVSLTDSEV